MSKFLQENLFHVLEKKLDKLAFENFVKHQECVSSELKCSGIKYENTFTLVLLCLK